MADSKKIELLSSRQTTWYLINVKARKDQNTGHYISAFRKIKDEDPLVEIGRNHHMSYKFITESSDKDKNGNAKWIDMTLMSYTIIDPNSFYNKREQKDLSYEWDPDVVANKKEIEMVFIPQVHKVAVRKSHCSIISVNSIKTYLQGAFEQIEESGFDIDIVNDKDQLARISKAHAVITIEANISFSNPDCTGDFQKVFEKSMRGMNAGKVTIIANGTTKNPLVCEEDGMIPTLVNMAEQNGTIKATIIENEKSKPIVLDSKEHPKVETVGQIIGSIGYTMWNHLVTLFT